MSLRVLLDVDGVVADLVGALAQATGLFEPEAVTAYAFDQCLPPEIVKVIGRVMVRPGFVEDMPTCEGARKLFADLVCAGHRPVFVTKPYAKSPTWAYERTRWLHKTFGADLHIVHTDKKGLVGGDILVEDSPENIEGWLEEHRKGWAFLVDRPWNRGDLCKRTTRVSDLDTIPRLLGKGWAA